MSATTKEFRDWADNPAASGMVPISPATLRRAADDIDRLKALNAELAKALGTLVKEEAPVYHDCTDNGEPECAWCMASAALAKQKETT